MPRENIIFNPFWDASVIVAKRYVAWTKFFNPFWDASIDLQNQYLTYARNFSIPFGMLQDTTLLLVHRLLKFFNPFWDAS